MYCLILLQVAFVVNALERLKQERSVCKIASGDLRLRKVTSTNCMSENFESDATSISRQPRTLALYATA